MLKQITPFLTMMAISAILVAACGSTPTTDTTDTETTASSNDTTTDAVEEGTAADDAATETDAAATTGKTNNYDTASQQITMWFMPNGAQPLQFMKKEADAFAEANPDIGIDYQLVDWGNAFTQIQTSLQGGSTACVAQLGTTWVPGFSATEGLRPFTDEEIQTMGGEEAFVPVSWELTSYADSDVVSAMPWFVDVRGIAYRTDIFEQAGIDPTEAFQDLDSFEAALMQLKEADLGIAPFVHPGRNDWNVWQNTSQFIWNYGGDILTTDNTQAIFNSDESVKAVQQFASFYGKGLTSPDTLELNSSQTEARFGNGEAATIIAPSYLISQANAPKDNGGWQNDEARANFAFAEFPAGPGGQFTFVGGSQLAIFRDCPHPEAAIKFVEHLTSLESQARYSSNIGMLPALREAQNDAAFEDPLYETFKQGSEKGKSAPAIIEWGGVENTFQTELQGIWEDAAASPDAPIDEATIKARLDAAAETVDGLLGN
ncbi:MAG: extracellular solute-binding protein [Chloroflexi bacterium AL-W]|nr:extracellular solute-binding protein [Chloroflexi bacterium AL-N1]NOK69402.1 extracellular solute-binding protein [Chloroflexi bacterium AL-N10]NOK76463.1 extracellular solute-binding protein [Chloroflexi bacterium AL-N5]NOK83580.1 extracellular solute-binding protein [Chloroflexi bacterium AL-W]NOK91240.1 extracellular solute-binding protein [Chloroflexi bacterium AL-N15]